MSNSIGSGNDFLFQKEVCEHVELNQSTEDRLFNVMQYKTFP